MRLQIYQSLGNSLSTQFPLDGGGVSIVCDSLRIPRREVPIPWVERWPPSLVRLAAAGGR